MRGATTEWKALAGAAVLDRSEVHAQTSCGWAKAMRKHIRSSLAIFSKIFYTKHITCSEARAAVASTSEIRLRPFTRKQIGLIQIFRQGRMPREKEVRPEHGSCYLHIPFDNKKSGVQCSNRNKGSALELLVAFMSTLQEPDGMKRNTMRNNPI